MDNIEITVFDEIKDYKEKIYFFNFRQWIFAILIIIMVVPTYLILKEKIGEEVTSYIVIAIAGILGFIGFVKIHELPAEKIMLFWFRHYLFFAKPIQYISDEEYILQHQKKKRYKSKKGKKVDQNKLKVKEMKEQVQKEKGLKKERKKCETKLENSNNCETVKGKNKKFKIKEKNNLNDDELSKRLSKLSKEQQEALLKLLER